MIEIRWTSIREAEWTGATRVPAKSSQFKTTYSNTLDLLKAELRRIGARQVSIAMDIVMSDLRKDGQLYADARPSSSRVLLTFERRIMGQGNTWTLLRFPCWSYLSWQENLHAITRTLEALRAVDRYGATEKDQQWTGFAALGAGDGAPRGGVNTQALALSPERAARILVEAHPTMGASTGVGIDVLAKAMLDRTAAEKMLKLAQESRAAAHPDKGGSDGLFATVNAAFEVVKAYHAGGR